MKIIRQGKEYSYDYKTIFIHGHHHKQLMELSKQKKVSAGEMIMKLINNYKKNNTENGL